MLARALEGRLFLCGEPAYATYGTLSLMTV